MSFRKSTILLLLLIAIFSLSSIAWAVPKRVSTNCTPYCTGLANSVNSTIDGIVSIEKDIVGYESEIKSKKEKLRIARNGIKLLEDRIFELGGLIRQVSTVFRKPPDGDSCTTSKGSQWHRQGLCREAV
jgi:hypothetical protein